MLGGRWRESRWKVLRACVVPVWIETVALTEQWQQKLQVCENNWVWGSTGAKRVDKWRMVDIREEIGMQFSQTGRTMRSRMPCHFALMEPPIWILV